MASIVATASGKVVRIQRKGPGGLEIWCSTMASSLSTATRVWPLHRLLKAKERSRGAEKLGVVGRTEVTVGTHLYFEMLVAGKPVDPAPYLRIPNCARE
jgi:murein DD-endopeptidase MepM/ murein hydrolase activator NlpD